MTRGARVGALVLAAALTPAWRRAADAKPAPSPDACAAATPAPGPGSLDPFRPPAPKATELNAAGKAPYRLGKWEEARAQYRAALAADPDFLAARLNVACSFVRQERFADATAEVVALVDRAYVPWAREVLEAADLGALKPRPEMKQIQAALATSAARWGEGLDTSLVFVARQRPPLKLPDGPGIFILNPHQEAWAYTPTTRRYRQLTAEDGHVVAVAHDGARIVYVTAEKLVRGAKPGDVALRRVVIHVLALATMSPEATGEVDGDVTRVELLSHGGQLKFTLWGDRAKGLYRFERGALVSTPMPRALPPPLAVLTGAGVAPVGPRKLPGPCKLVARDERGQGAMPRVLVAPAKGGKPLALAAAAGAGLSGLSIP